MLLSAWPNQKRRKSSGRKDDWLINWWSPSIDTLGGEKVDLNYVLKVIATAAVFIADWCTTPLFNQLLLLLLKLVKCDCSFDEKARKGLKAIDLTEQCIEHCQWRSRFFNYFLSILFFTLSLLLPFCLSINCPQTNNYYFLLLLVTAAAASFEAISRHTPLSRMHATSLHSALEEKKHFLIMIIISDNL